MFAFAICPLVQLVPDLSFINRPHCLNPSALSAPTFVGQGLGICNFDDGSVIVDGGMAEENLERMHEEWGWLGMGGGWG
jgi:hypothetical protein